MMVFILTFHNKCVLGEFPSEVFKISYLLCSNYVLYGTPLFGQCSLEDHCSNFVVHSEFSDCFVDQRQ